MDHFVLGLPKVVREAGSWNSELQSNLFGCLAPREIVVAMIEGRHKRVDLLSRQISE